MARMVTLWRCKCGTGIKVIAEIDSSPPAKQTASCPKCYALHAVHADRIITITEDTYDLGPLLFRVRKRNACSLRRIRQSTSTAVGCRSLRWRLEWWLRRNLN